MASQPEAFDVCTEASLAEEAEEASREPSLRRAAEEVSSTLRRLRSEVAAEHSLGRPPVEHTAAETPSQSLRWILGLEAHLRVPHSARETLRLQHQQRLHGSLQLALSATLGVAEPFMVDPREARRYLSKRPLDF